MAMMNVWKRMFPVRTHAGAVAQKVDAKSALRRTVLTCLLWEDTLRRAMNRDAHRRARRREQAGSCGGTRAGSTRQNAASSRAALPHARTRAPQGRGPARGGDDKQSHDGILRAWTPRAYVVNVAPYKHGISYGSGWTHIDGWSERIIDYIAAVEVEAAA